MARKAIAKKSAKKTSGKVSSKSVLPSKKHFSLAAKCAGFFELMRPAEWSKPLLNMTLALLIAFYVYGSGISLGVFVAGFVSVITLWGALYTLNDITDWRIDALHPVKKNRAIPSGRVTPAQALWFSVILMIVSYLIAFALNNPLLVVCLSAMLINQYLYSTKPFRLKSRKGLDIISGSMINPIFRYLSGLVLFVPVAAFATQLTPVLPIIFVVTIQAAGYSLYRLFSKSHDKKVKMKSTVALLPEKMILFYSYVLIVVSAISFLGMFANFYLFRIEELGFIPWQYLLAIVVVLLALPFIKDAITSPTKASMKKNYRALYVMTTVFALANLAIFVLAA